MADVSFWHVGCSMGELTARDDDKIHVPEKMKQKWFANAFKEKTKQNHNARLPRVHCQRKGQDSR